MDSNNNNNNDNKKINNNTDVNTYYDSDEYNIICDSSNNNICNKKQQRTSTRKYAIAPLPTNYILTDTCSIPECEKYPRVICDLCKRMFCHNHGELIQAYSNNDNNSEKHWICNLCNNDPNRKSQIYAIKDYYKNIPIKHNTRYKKFIRFITFGWMR